MLKQFEVIRYMGKRFLTEVDTSRYDFVFGLRRVVKVLE